MATTKHFIEAVGEVTIIRRRGLKNISIRLDHSGAVRLNLPWFVPKATGLAFVKQRQNWIEQQQAGKVQWSDGQEISGVKLNILLTDKSSSSWSENAGNLVVSIPNQYDSAKKQQAINKTLTDYLRAKTKEMIFPKVLALAQQNGRQVKQLSTKKFRSRWGSCDHKGNITLSLYLSTLPEDLWTYVICHELAHLEQLNHSPKFWQVVEQMYPDYKTARKRLKNHSPGTYIG